VAQSADAVVINAKLGEGLPTHKTASIITKDSLSGHLTQQAVMEEKKAR